jgi:hypothetical protein
MGRPKGHIDRRHKNYVKKKAAGKQSKKATELSQVKK